MLSHVLLYLLFFMKVICSGLRIELKDFFTIHIHANYCFSF
jgi:hypothetical protein